MITKTDNPRYNLVALLAPLLAFPLLSAILPQGSAWGAALRIAFRGSVSILALIGFYNLRDAAYS